MDKQSFDIVVIGGGPGGYVAAIRAAQLGLKACVIEREHLGGICLNWGCIPTKALLRSSEIHHMLHHLDDYGLSADNPSFDLAAVVKRSRGIATQLSGGVKHLLKKNKVVVIDGEATLKTATTVSVTKGAKAVAEVSATHVIIATGARARELPGLVADGKLIWTYKEALVPAEIPKRLLVVGSGAIGMEFASFYSDMGAEVTVVEMLDRILPQEDAEISALALKAFTGQGMTIHTGAGVTALKAGKSTVKASIKLSDGKPADATFDRVILAIGITGNVEGLGLEALGVVPERGHIPTDPFGYTGTPGLWAIGDVTGPPWLAHKAMHEGVITVEHIARVKGVHALNKANIPGCTYCRPQVASVGLTEEAAKKAGYAVKVGRFPFMGNGKAIALGEPEGLVKTVFDAKTGELLGAHMIGAEVTELIQGYAIARTMETTEAELMATVFPHPTLSEMMHESVLAAYGKALHI
ncbi:MAG: dihydrolipoyl dehydrogenase [Proteobacteria bacterium]|nr:dihydrolipoyl dehydrogenase [Pseudomonadota bacterium]